MARAVFEAMAGALLRIFLLIALFTPPSRVRSANEVNMGLRARILTVVQLECGGPRNKNVLKSLARTPAQVEEFERIFDDMLASGELVMYSDKRHAVYGPPGLRRRRGSWVELGTVAH